MSALATLPSPPPAPSASLCTSRNEPHAFDSPLNHPRTSMATINGPFFTPNMPGGELEEQGPLREPSSQSLHYQLSGMSNDSFATIIDPLVPLGSQDEQVASLPPTPLSAPQSARTQTPDSITTIGTSTVTISQLPPHFAPAAPSVPPSRIPSDLPSPPSSLCSSSLRRPSPSGQDPHAEICTVLFPLASPALPPPLDIPTTPYSSSGSFVSRSPVSTRNSACLLPVEAPSKIDDVIEPSTPSSGATQKDASFLPLVHPVSPLRIHFSFDPPTPTASPPRPQAKHLGDTVEAQDGVSPLRTSGSGGPIVSDNPLSLQLSDDLALAWRARQQAKRRAASAMRASRLSWTTCLEPAGAATEAADGTEAAPAGSETCGNFLPDVQDDFYQPCVAQAQAQTHVPAPAAARPLGVSSPQSAAISARTCTSSVCSPMSAQSPLSPQRRRDVSSVSGRSSLSLSHASTRGSFLSVRDAWSEEDGSDGEVDEHDDHDDHDHERERDIDADVNAKIVTGADAGADADADAGADAGAGVGRCSSGDSVYVSGCDSDGHVYDYNHGYGDSPGPARTAFARPSSVHPGGEEDGPGTPRASQPLLAF